MNFEQNSPRLDVQGFAPFVRETIYSAGVDESSLYKEDFSEVESRLDEELDDVPEVADSIAVVNSAGSTVLQYFPGGREIGRSQVEQLNGDTSVLEDNMTRNDWSYVIETCHGKIVAPSEDKQVTYDIF